MQRLIPLIMINQALSALLTMVNSLNPGQSYGTDIWVNKELIQLFRAVLGRLNSIHEGLESNSQTDGALWTLAVSMGMVMMV